MQHKQLMLLVMTVLISVGLFINSAIAQPSLEAWKPDFDPSGATYTCIVSNVSHPVLKGVYAGFAIRDALWERTNGQIYLDYKPFSMLGGEVEVLNQLQMGVIQGMPIEKYVRDAHVQKHISFPVRTRFRIAEALAGYKRGAPPLLRDN